MSNLVGYSVALEKQIELLRWLDSGAGRIYAQAAAERAGLPVSTGSNHIGMALGRALEDGQTFFWSSMTADLVASAARSLPATFRLTDTALVARNGFFWFDTPLVLGESGIGPLRALCWSVWPAFEMPAGQAQPQRGERSIFMQAPDGARPTGNAVMVVFWVEVDESTRRHLMPVTFTPWPIGASLSNVAQLPEATGRVVVGPDQQLRIAKLRLWATCLLFIEQRILVSQRQHAERHARKRLNHEGWNREPVIHVVQLRRTESRNKGVTSPVEREWSCQWIVGGHWRQQWFVNRRTHAPIWITPYIKGPEGKPIKPPRATVFAVVR